MCVHLVSMPFLVQVVVNLPNHHFSSTLANQFWQSFTCRLDQCRKTCSLQDFVKMMVAMTPLNVTILILHLVYSIPQVPHVIPHFDCSFRKDECFAVTLHVVVLFLKSDKSKRFTATCGLQTKGISTPRG